MRTMLNLVGAWRLTSSYFVDSGTAECCDMFAGDVFGSAVFESTGRMLVLMTSGSRVPAESDSDGSVVQVDGRVYRKTVDDESWSRELMARGILVGSAQKKSGTTPLTDKLCRFERHLSNIRIPPPGSDWLRCLAARTMIFRL